MSDIRIQRLVKVLADYSIEVKPGQWVRIDGDVETLPMLRELYAYLTERGAHVTTQINDAYMTREFYRHASDDQLLWQNPSSRLQIEKLDARIVLLGQPNTRAMTNIDATRMQKHRASMMDLFQISSKRAADGDYKWALTQFPTEAAAQEANMSLEEYEDFIYSACYCDRDDPVAEWRRVHDEQASKVDWLKGKREVTCKGPNIDLSLRIDDRIFINGDGKNNMPCGEIFTGPVEDSANGWVRFTYPSIVNGRAVSGIELTFENGKVVNASAEQNDDLLQSQLNTDEGARYLGEFAIGTNFGIQQFTGNILFDEKIGGTIHMAIGNSYPETGGKNKSAVHWDMICDMRNESEIHVDGELFYQNGSFVI